MERKWCLLKLCLQWGSKLTPPDGHSLCLRCLGVGHQTDSCTHCIKFLKQTKKNREAWHGTALLESALRLHKMASISGATPTKPPHKISSTQTSALTQISKASKKDQASKAFGLQMAKLSSGILLSVTTKEMAEGQRAEVQTAKGSLQSASLEL